MKIVGRDGGSDKLTKLPSTPKHFDDNEKKYYREIGKTLIAAGVLKSIHLIALEVLATNRALWIYAVSEISKKNKERLGSGYVQTYDSGATNITTELSIKSRAEKAMLENLALFGMDPQNEKKLTKAVTSPNQLNAFAAFNKKKHG